MKYRLAVLVTLFLFWLAITALESGCAARFRDTVMCSRFPAPLQHVTVIADDRGGLLVQYPDHTWMRVIGDSCIVEYGQ